MSVTADTGITRRYQVQPAVPYCTREDCGWLPSLVCNDDGAHKAALGHAAATGHETHVAETGLTIYTRTGGTS